MLIRTLLRKMGGTRLMIVFTVLSVGISTSASLTVWLVLNLKELASAMIMSTVLPLILAPTMTYAIFNLLERLDRAELEREKLIRDLQETMANVKTLKGLLPICASCKKIRDDRGYWKQIESYIREHSDAEFTHGITRAKRLHSRARTLGLQ